MKKGPAKLKKETPAMLKKSALRMKKESMAMMKKSVAMMKKASAMQMKMKKKKQGNTLYLSITNKNKTNDILIL